MQAQHLLAALRSLNPEDDAHWTADGQARVDVVSGFLAQVDIEPVQRQDIIDAAPTFTRATAVDLSAEWAMTGTGIGRMNPDPAATDAELTAPEQPPADASALEAPPAPPAASDEQPAASPPETTLDTLELNPGRPTVLSEALEPGQRACDLPVERVFADPVLLGCALQEMSDESQALIAERERIEEKLKKLHRKSELCSIQYERIRPKEDPGKNIRDYLAATNKANADKVARTRAFVKAGVKPTDIMKELLPNSKLDQVMSQRKPAPGSTRPALGMPVRI